MFSLCIPSFFGLVLGYTAKRMLIFLAIWLSTVIYFMLVLHQNNYIIIDFDKINDEMSNFEIADIFTRLSGLPIDIYLFSTGFWLGYRY